MGAAPALWGARTMHGGLSTAPAGTGLDWEPAQHGAGGKQGQTAPSTLQRNIWMMRSAQPRLSILLPLPF